MHRTVNLPAGNINPDAMNTRDGQTNARARIFASLTGMKIRAVTGVPDTARKALEVRGECKTRPTPSDKPHDQNRQPMPTLMRSGSTLSVVSLAPDTFTSVSMFTRL